MKKLAIMLITLLCAVCFAQTQLDINKEAHNSYLNTDKELNRVYKQIRIKYSNDSLMLKKLRDAQLLWIKFRDESAKALFPYEDNRMHFGSIYPTLYSLALATLTENRIEQLKYFYLDEMHLMHEE